jgi:hypothetical protein
LELETLQKALGEGKELRIEHAGAETIRKALVDKPENSTKFDPRGLRLTGTRITGDLDLSHAAISIPLTFEDCIFCGQIILDGAQLADVIMRRCESTVQLTAITACDATITGNLVLDGFTATTKTDQQATVLLRGAHIKRDLSLTGANLTNTTGAPLVADDATVDGNASFGEHIPHPSEFKTAGAGTNAVSIRAFTVGGKLSFAGATLNSKFGTALYASHITVGQTATFERITAHAANHAIQLGSARIGAVLVFDGAQLCAKGTALAAKSISVGSDANFKKSQTRPFEATTKPTENTAHTDNSARLDTDTALATAGYTETPRPAITLAAARIEGDLCLDGGVVSSSVGPALDGEALRIRGSMLSEGASYCGAGRTGALRLIRATIGGRLDLGGVTLTNPTGSALRADHLHVADTVRLDDGFKATAFTRPATESEGSEQNGAIRLFGAKIGGQLRMHGATVTNPRGPAIRTDRLEVGGNLYLDNGFTTRGEIEKPGHIALLASTIGGKIICTTPDDSPRVTTFSLEGTTTRGLRLDERFGPQGQRWLTLDRLTYRDVPEGLVGTTVTPSRTRPCRDRDATPWPVADSIRILRECTREYSPQAWQQLASAHRALGHDPHVRRILINQHRDFHERVLKQSGTEKADQWSRIQFHSRLLWSKTLDKVIAYGYRSHRAFGFLIVVVAAAVLLAVVAGCVHVDNPNLGGYVAQTTRLTIAGAPCSLAQQLGLGLEIGLPLFKTAVGGQCQLNSIAGIGQVFTAVSWLLQALAWTFATLAVAGYTGLIRKT